MSVDEYIEDAIETLNRLLGVVKGVKSNIIKVEADIKFRIKQLENLMNPNEMKTAFGKINPRDFLARHGYPESEIVLLLKSKHLFYFLE